MIPYLLFIIILLIAFGLRKPSVMVTIITLFSVFRFDTGWDYDSYYQAFTDSVVGNIAKMSWGPLWAWWIDFIYDKSIPFIGIGVPAVLTSIFLYYSLKLLHEGHHKAICESLLAYSVWPFLYLGSFCTVRQSLAMAIGLLIFALTYRKYYILSIILYVLAYFVHPSSFIVIFFIPILLLKRNITLIQLLGLIISIVLLMGFLSSILTVLGLDNYIEYMSDSDSFGGKIVYIYAILSLFCLVVVKKSETEENLFAKIFSLMALGMILNFLIYITNIPSVLSRAVSYLMIFFSPGLFYGIRKISKVSLVRRAIVSFFVLFFFLYLFVTQGSAGAVSQFVPYKTFLFE